MQTVTADVQAIIAQHADETRANRQVAGASVQALKDCGFFKTLLPKKWGGLECRPQDFFADHIKIAEADMSTAWACGIIAVHAFQIAMMDEQAQRDVYGEDPNTLVSSSYNPVGAKAEPCEGGFMLSGRWGWSSGSGLCTWALLGSVIPGDGYRTMLVPIGDYVIEDTWDVMGLEGTGSNDIVIEKPVFVPLYRTHHQIDGFNCVNDQENPLYGLPWAQTFIRVVNTPAIGALKHALKTFIESRTGATTDMTKLASDVEIQERVAKVKNIIAELESVLFRNFDEMEACGWKPSMEQRILYRYQASLVSEKCLEGIDILFDAAGGRSVFNGHPIQQHWKDIHMSRCHVANNPTPFARNLGSTSFGMDNQDFFV
ncbi:MAG: hypothetical protein RL336_270 [Pseudomonadota bacterium]|jgi:3-hydroxy-9,10-secoandrosta-1,3,5(10)-triene-9,17-dione monooxygenase